MATTTIKNADGTTVTTGLYLPGPAGQTDSLPVVSCTEDRAVQQSIVDGVADVATAIAGIAAGGDATAANQVTGNGHLTTINTSIGATNTALGTANASLSVMDDWDESDRAKVNVIVGQAGVSAGAGAVAANTPRVTVASDDPLVTAMSRGYNSDITVTRAANTTAYTAGDVVGGAITFTSAGPTSGNVAITSLIVNYNVTALPTGMTSLRLYLYNATPPSAVADNGVFDLPSGDRSAYLGFIDIPTLQDVGSTLIAVVPNPGLQVKLAATTSLFGYLVTTAGWTPAANSETFLVSLRTVAM